MPSGGISGSGSGLRLQSSTPGQTDVGNFNIQGIGIAQTGFSTTINTNGNESFGHNVPNPSSYSNNNSVFFGSGISTGTGAAGPFMGIGNNLRASGQGCIAVGIGCSSGPSTSNGLPNWSFGYQCTAGALAGSNGYNLAIGWTCSANGGQNIAIGKNVTCSTTNTGNEDAIAFGSSITAGSTATKALLLGLGISLPGTGKTNVLAVGWFAPGVGTYPATGAGAVDNSILIGNPSQTVVKIGPYSISQSSGSTITANDTNVVLTADIGTLRYTGITAARTVTLPAANAVQDGYRVTICDFSGNCSAVRTITALPAGADTIVFGNSLNNPFDTHEYMSDGVSQWLQTLDTR